MIEGSFAFASFKVHVRPAEGRVRFRMDAQAIKMSDNEAIWALNNARIKWNKNIPVLIRNQA